MDANLLSDREIEVLQLVGQGKSNKEIAMDLDISVNTVKVHIGNIFQKINVTSRTEATLYAIEKGIVTPALPIENQDATTRSNEEEEPLAEKDNLLGKMTIPILTLLGVLIITIAILAVIRHNTPEESSSSLMVNFSAEDRWLSYNTLNTPRSNLAAVVYESQIYAIGGDLKEGVSGDTEMYLSTENIWISLQEKPTPVTGITAILIGERIYVPGGKTVDGEVTDRFEVYDPRLNVWEERANLPIGLSDYGLAAFGGYLYLFGGWNGSQPSELTFCYNPEEDTWSELSKLPEPWVTVVAIQIENRIVLTGKTEQTSSTTSMISYYPNRDIPGENPWQEETPLPRGGNVSCFFDLLGAMYAVVNREKTTEFFSYDEQNNEWISIAQNESLLSKNSRCSVIGGELFLVGGTKADGTPSDQLLGYKMIYSISLPGIVN